MAKPTKTDKQATFSITAPLDAVKPEGDTGTTDYTFTITRTGSSNKAASVSYGVTDAQADDFAGAAWPSGTVAFERGETSKTITIAVAGDTTFEESETFKVALSNPIGGEITAGSATGTITNDDDAPSYAIAVSPTAAAVAEDSAGLLTYTVTRTGPSDVASTITYALSGSAGTSDYTQSGTGTLTFAAGQSTASFTADPTLDGTFEFDETVIATLSTPSDGGMITTASAMGTITNDDAIGRVSVDSNETQAIPPGYSYSTWDNYTHSISADGRYVTFFSNSPNLVAGDTNGTRDIFIRDLLLGTTERVSVNSDEGQGTSSGYTPLFSESYAPAISANGRFVTFFSDANNLVLDDTNSANDVFVRDLQLGITTRAIC